MTTTYNIYLFDNCCHQWISQDNGATWKESATPNMAQDIWGNPPVGTLLDDWSDGQMAINDADYLTLVAWDNNYNSNVGFGIIGISKLAGIALSWTLNDPEKNATGTTPSPAFTSASDPNFGTDQQIAFSGAITSGGAIILYCTSASSTSDKPFYPRISRNAGVTWSDLTGGLPANKPWARAAFSAGGTTMYLLPDNTTGGGFGTPNHYIFKSTDTGATWAELGSGPQYHELADAGEGRVRLRCSSNGQVIVAMGYDGMFWLSTNGGTSWASTNFAAVTGNPAGDFGDCSVTPDGNTIVVAFGQRINNGTYNGNWPAVFASTNGGASFANVSANLQYPASVGAPVGGAPGLHPTDCTACNVSPDGLGIIVTFNYTDNPHTEPDGLPGFTTYVNVSTNAGAAFTLRSMDADPFQSGSALGVFTAIYIVPFTVIPPLPPPPTQRRGAYLIERMDNRNWPAKENVWAVDCALQTPLPTPNAKLTPSSSTGAGIPTGVTALVGGAGYSAGTTAAISDPTGAGAVVTPTIVLGVITGVGIAGGTNYTNPQLVFTDPGGTGSGASATVTLNNSATFTADAPVFSLASVGQVIRVGGGKATVTGFTDTQHVTVNITAPIAQTIPNSGGIPETAASGSWSMAPLVTKIGGLFHLKGATVTGLADGVPIPPQVVSATGTITLATPASLVTVGLAFLPQLQTLYLDGGQQTMQARRKKLAAVNFLLEASGVEAITAGANQPDGSTLSPMRIDPPWGVTPAPPMAALQLQANQNPKPYGSAISPLFTGFGRAVMSGGFAKPAQMAIQQNDPLPLQVLSCVPEYLDGDTPEATAGRGQQPDSAAPPQGRRKALWGPE